MRSTRLITVALIAIVMAGGACGGGDSNEGSDTSEENQAACQPVEEVAIEEAEDYHQEGEFTADDYSTSPPAGGMHALSMLSEGEIYPKPQPLGNAVHTLDHGAVIVWTNGVEPEARSEIEAWHSETVPEDPFKPGNRYTAVIVVENPDMDTPIAMSAWGALQKCTEWDPAAADAFIEEHYASGPEGTVACGGLLGDPVDVPRCNELTS